MKSPPPSEGMTAGFVASSVRKDQKPKLIEPMMVRGGLICA